MDPWSKGDYSRHIMEESMAMEGLPRVVPPSGRVPGQLLLAAEILKRRRRRYREEFGNNIPILGVSSAGAKYRPKGTPRGATRPPRGQVARPRGAAPDTLLGPWWWPSCQVLVIPKASVALIFYIIFPEFLEHFSWLENLKYKNSRKQELATGCTDLIG